MIFKKFAHLKSNCIERCIVCIFLKAVYCYKETFQYDFKFVLIICSKLKDFENKMDYN